VTYNKAFFVFAFGIFTGATIVFCMIMKLFLLEKLSMWVGGFSNNTFGYLVVVTVKDIKMKKECKVSFL
jgi:riboflavin transporter FmnP